MTRMSKSCLLEPQPLPNSEEPTKSNSSVAWLQRCVCLCYIVGDAAAATKAPSTLAIATANTAPTIDSAKATAYKSNRAAFVDDTMQLCTHRASLLFTSIDDGDDGDYYYWYDF